MSMDFSEFIRMLGADPRNRDPAFRRARESSAEFRAAAAESDRFETQVERAVNLPAPAALAMELKHIARPQRARWRRPMSLAAGVVLVLAAAVLLIRTGPGDAMPMPDYLAEHFEFDGHELLERAASREPFADINLMLAEFGLQLAPELVARVRAVKLCSTPKRGKGVHFVLESGEGFITVFVLPDTEVQDGQTIEFDSLHAILVTLGVGSAAAIGGFDQNVADYRVLLQGGLVPLAT